MGLRQTAFCPTPTLASGRDCQASGLRGLGGPWPEVLQAAQADTGCECGFNLLWLVQGGSRGKNQGSWRPLTESWLFGAGCCRGCASDFCFYICAPSIVPVQTPRPVGLRVLLAWRRAWGRVCKAQARIRSDRARAEAGTTRSPSRFLPPFMSMRWERVDTRTDPRAAGLSCLVWAPL